MVNRVGLSRMLAVLIVLVAALSFCFVFAAAQRTPAPAVPAGDSLSPNSSSTSSIDPAQLQQTLWSMLLQADWGGQNNDMAIPANEWTPVGEAGGDNAVSVGGNYGLLLLGTIVVTGGTQDGTVRWRTYPNGWNPNTNPWFASSPALTVHAGDTVSIPVVGSFPLVNVRANTGVALKIDIYASEPMTIRGGGQGYSGLGGSGSGNPCTVFVGILWPYHEH